MIRQFKPSDVDEVFNIQKKCYVENLHESKDVFLQYHHKFQEGFIVAEKNSKILGYCVSFPYYRGQTTQKNAKGNHFDCYYIHDIAIDPDLNEKGLSGKMIERINQITFKNGFNVQCLTAVNNRRGYWEQKGFKFCKKVNIFDVLEADLMERILSKL